MTVAYIVYQTKIVKLNSKHTKNKLKYIDKMNITMQTKDEDLFI